MGVTILVLGRMSDDGLTISWWEFASSFVRINIEGGVAALIASLIPYPRFATQDGALRAQVCGGCRRSLVALCTVHANAV